MYILYIIKKDRLDIIDKKDVIDFLYYLKARIPTKKDIKKYLENNSDNNIIDYFKEYGIITGIERIKKDISKIDYKIPLYDIGSKNIYIINRNRVYQRVVYNHYRFPDSHLVNKLKKKKTNLDIIISKIKKTSAGKLTETQKNLGEQIKNTKETHEDIILLREYRKLKLMIDFMNSFNMDELNTTYIKVFYYYSNEVGKDITMCKRPSFMPHFTHVTPYYTRKELINLALNMGLIKSSDKYYGTDELMMLCKKVTRNDISSSSILSHQKHIIKEDKIGIVKYYSMQGSYFMNQYLRDDTPYDYKNEKLEKLISSMWELIDTSPSFDKDYILYRFIKTDNHLKELTVGEEYTNPSFISTTRDPFYSSDEYKFGFILVKIKIPKNTPGVALCIESLSHFPKEEEIILPPLSILRLDSRDKGSEYYHIDYDFSLQVKTRYEFTYIGKEPMKFTQRPLLADVSIPLDFLKISKKKTYGVNEKIKQFMLDHVTPIFQFDTLIGTQKFTTFIEWYDSTGAYKDFYAVNTSHGFSIYSIDMSHVNFMIEIGENENGSYMHTNYYLRYSTSSSNREYSDEDFITFLSSIAYYFEIPSIYLYTDYYSCDVSQKMIEIYVKKERNYGVDIQDYIYSKKCKKIKARTISLDKINKSNNIDCIIKKYYGGNFCVDIYNYLKTGKKRYRFMDSTEIRPKYNYFMLDKLKTINPLQVLKQDKDQIYQIYDEVYLRHTTKNNVASFYIWMVEHYCYLIKDLVDKISKLYEENNPFVNDYYEIDPGAFLYNRNLIATIPSFSKKKQDNLTNSLINIPKNKYRITDTRRSR